MGGHRTGEAREVQDELTRRQGRRTTTASPGGSKSDELVPHREVIDDAEIANAPPPEIPLTMDTYGAPRRLQVHRAVSRERSGPCGDLDGG